MRDYIQVCKNRKITAVLLVLALLLCSCKNGSVSANTTALLQDTVLSETTAATETEGWNNPVTDEDFASVQVNNKALVRVGETEQLTSAWGNAVWRSSKPSVASVSSDGTVMANSPGVALILVKNTDDSSMSAWAYAVIGKDENPDFTLSGAVLHEVGETDILQVDIAAPTLSSNNESAVKPADGLEINFVGAGIACVTAASASVPRFFYFLIYDRDVEEE